MKRQAYLRDENLLTLLSLNDFIIPEIQREYVWGSSSNSEKILKPFLESIRNSAHVDEHCHYAHGNDNLHIGFLYSYKPQYIRDISERITDEYLIDGQQRFTSLFLLLLVRAIKENRLADFNNLIRWEDGNIAFDYKVRQLTHLFIIDFISHVQDNGEKVLNDIINEDYPSWLMKDYLSDTTVTNIIGALICINKVFSEKEDKYYDYLLTRIHFWHFKTDVTSQGEELYITMNSRGEALTDNEVQKARKLKNTNLYEFGPLWEDIQTYFWRNRHQGKNANNFDADKGFNNLLSCISAMGDCFEKDYSGIQDIRTAVNALRYIVDKNWDVILKAISPTYYSDWITTFKNDVWTRINTTTAKWSIEKDSDTVQRENAVLLWPLFYYYFEHNNGVDIDEMTFIRLMHLCYLNYHSKKTNHVYIRDFIDELCSTGNNMLFLSSIKKNSFLSNENIELSTLINNSSSPEDLESTIWQVQDCPYFLDGEDVGGDTIIEFVKSIQEIGLDICLGLQNLYKNYNIFFPSSDGKKNEVILKRILLHYKGINNEPFWKRTSPYYDRNYETSSWKRIVRHSTFLLFYTELSNGYNKIITQKDLETFVETKQNEFFIDPNNRDFIAQKWDDRRLAILFDTMTGGHLWNNDKLTDLRFSEEDMNIPVKTFIGNTRIDNRICGKRFQWHKITLPSSWEGDLQRMYPNYTFVF